jgi:hypothetical protein
MICYRDRTYCDCPTCVAPRCFDRLTFEILVAAEEWGLPVSTGDFSTVCMMYMPKSEVKKNEKRNES